MRFLFLLLVFVASAQARLLQDEITGSTIIDLSFKQACELQGHKELPLIEAVGNEKLDCMGKIISLSSSCQNNKTEGFLKVSLQEKNVRCYYGKQVMIRIECDERDKSYCLDSKKSCLSLGQKFAMNLELFRHSIVDHEKAKVLNCLFDSSKNEVPDKK